MFGRPLTYRHLYGHLGFDKFLCALTKLFIFQAEEAASPEKVVRLPPEDEEGKL